MSNTAIALIPPVVRCRPDQAAKSYAYLQSFVAFDANPKVTVSAMFARSCLATHPDFALDCAAAVRDAGDIAERTLAHPDRARLDLDPLLLLTSYAAFADAGYEVPALREVAAQAARSLAPLDAKTRRVGRVRLIASVLAARGFDVAVESRPKEIAEWTDEPSHLLNASAVVLADVADHLMADAQTLDTDLSTMLALTALGELRNYRIDLGAKLLRLVVAQGAPLEEVEEGLNFVALQRRRNGAYGFLNPFSVEEHQDIDTTFFLPMTLNAVWLLHTEAAWRDRRSDAAADGMR